MDIKRNRIVRCGLDSSGSGEGLVVGSCAHDKEPAGSIKCWEFKWMSNCWLLKNDTIEFS
jgi:hypothetical protein